MKVRLPLAVPAVVALVLLAIAGAGCHAPKSSAQPVDAAAVTVSVSPVVQQQVTRTLRLTGSLIAEEEAEVAAETAGAWCTTPVERGTAVQEGDALVRIAPMRGRRLCPRGRGECRAARSAPGAQAGRAVRRRARAGSRGRQGDERAGPDRLRPDPHPARATGGVPGGVRPAARAGRGDAQPVRGRPATTPRSCTGSTPPPAPG